MINQIYEDVIEVIRCFEPMSPLLALKTNRVGYLERCPSYSIMEIGNGKAVVLPKSPGIALYRGESEDYDLKYPCIPSIYRGNPTKSELVVSRLKMMEFEIVIHRHPRIKKATEWGIEISYEALSQHYELKSDLLDLSSDIAVAAFFATNEYDKKSKSYFPIEEGVGCLRRIPGIYGSDEKLLLFGIQPFKRPEKQCAFGYKLSEGDNFSNMSAKYLFKQNEKYGRLIAEAFKKNGENDLFPHEDISAIAELINSDNNISKQAIEKYCLLHNINSNEVESILEKKGISVTDIPRRKLSRQQIRAIDRNLPDNIYEGLDIRTRLVYK